ncbi:polysaccharide deacetylase family protein [Paenarthrobacter sp. RAF54_2]|uniref:polysaccharide deacetylase family protein n=1 Tax=Paenarthrobacter sp. RAF54_2 TaxID=3233061 RepID=UPI003F9B1003
MTGNGPPADLPSQGKARRRMVAVVVLAAVLVVAAGLALMLSMRPGAAPEAPAQGASSESPVATTSPGSAASSHEAPPSSEPPLVPPPESVPGTSDTAPATPPVRPFPESLLGQDLTSIPGAGNKIALTFDGGANAAGLQSILSTLDREQISATFFLTGTWAAANPDGVARIAAAGHRLGNHSMTHPAFTQLTDLMIADEIGRAESAIVAAGGAPRPFFRFPFGDHDSRTINTVNSLGYVPVRWSVDTLGWKGTSGGMSRESVAQRVLGGLQPGGIILMHIGSNPDDGSTLDADALPLIIEGTRSAGFGFATLDALLAG